MKHLPAQLALVFLFLANSLLLRAQKETPTRVEPPSTQITIQRPAGVNISGPTTVCKGGETILKAEGDYESFEWNTGVKDRFLRVREEGTYEVTVTTKGGCRLSTSVTVRMIPCT
jgi:hypothetical protein